MILSSLLVGLPVSLKAENTVIALQEGQPAPFIGFLYPPQLAIRVTQKIERCTFLIAEEQKVADRKIALVQSVCAEHMKINQDASDAKMMAVQDAFDFNPWWQTVLWIGGSVLAGFGMYAATDAIAGN